MYIYTYIFQDMNNMNIQFFSKNLQTRIIYKTSQNFTKLLLRKEKESQKNIHKEHI